MLFDCLRLENSVRLSVHSNTDWETLLGFCQDGTDTTRGVE